MKSRRSSRPDPREGRSGLTRRAGLGALVGLAIAAAAPRVARAQGKAAQGEAAIAPIERLDAALLAAMRQGSAGTAFATRYQALLPVVQGVFDLPTVLQEVVGLGWATLPDAQRQALLRAFTAFTVATYVANFDSYDGQSFVLAPAPRAAGADIVVNTRFQPQTGRATALDYVMRQGPQGWRAIDVLLDGTISRAATQRADFQSVLAGGSGGQALIDSLRGKVRTLSSGTVSP